MKRAAVFVWLTVLFALAPCPVRAYWDDVHYDLTYYEARLAGYTPEQAYRIAAAALSIDYDPATEPGQMSKMEYALGVSPASPEKQALRWKFHALRDETALKEPIGNGADAQKADAALRSQAESLYTAAVASKNPGIFIHFGQDRSSHRGYGSAWGHYFDPDNLLASTDAARKAGLSIGGSVDWLSHYDKKENIDLVYNAAQWLQKYMVRVSPNQKGRREFTFADSEDMLDQLRDRNAAPPGLQTTEYKLYIDYVAALNGVGKAPALSAQQSIDFAKNNNGPDLNAARDIVNAAMSAKGFSERTAPDYVAARKKYRFNAAGGLVGAFDVTGRPVADPLDEWVIVGSLKLLLKSDGPREQEPVEVVFKAPPTMTGETEYDLTKPAAMKIGETQTFKELPVGAVTIEVRRDGKILKRETNVRITKQENEFTLTIGLKPWVLRSDAPKIRWSKTGAQYELAAGYPRFSPENLEWHPVKMKDYDDFECTLPPGGSVTWVYAGTKWPATGRTSEITLTDSRITVRNTAPTGEKKAQYAFEFTYPRLPAIVRPEDVVDVTLNGTASVTGDASEPTVAFMRAMLMDAFSADPGLKSMVLGMNLDRGGTWAPDAGASMRLPYPAGGGLDWGSITYQFQPIEMVIVSLTYSYIQTGEDSAAAPATATARAAEGTPAGQGIGSAAPRTTAAPLAREPGGGFEQPENPPVPAVADSPGGTPADTAPALPPPAIPPPPVPPPAAPSRPAPEPPARTPIPDGLGVKLAVRDGAMVVVAVEPNTLAALMEIKPGDRILKIDGRSTDGMSPEQVESLLQGKSGVAMTVEMLRAADNAAISATITRTWSKRGEPGTPAPDRTAPSVPLPSDTTRTAPSPPAPLPPAGDTVAAWYRFDDGSGNIARDSSGQRRDLTLYGNPSFANGLQGGGLRLRDSNDVYAGRDRADPELNFGGRDFAIDLSVRFNDLAHEQTLIEKFSGASGPGWSLTALSTTMLQFYATGAAAFNAPVSLLPNEWYRIEVRRSSGRLRIRVNDRTVLDEAVTGEIGANEMPLLIGKRNAQDGRVFPVNGDIDEVRISVAK